MADFGIILLTTDLSETSSLAFDPALTVAERFGSRLVVLHVVEDRLPPFVDEFTAIPMEEILASQRDRAREELERFASAHLGEVREAELRVVHGTPHLEIVRQAEELGAGLIVMATHGRGFISHALFGSTAERVLRRASCPVLTVRSPRDES
jgi:nucleotide-binding universal stress UspA family protein